METEKYIFLSDLKIGDKKIVQGFDDFIDIKVKRRLLELGFINGTLVYVDNFSFLGEVILLEINGYLLSLRKDIASHILVR